MDDIRSRSIDFPNGYLITSGWGFGIALATAVADAVRDGTTGMCWS